MLVIKFREAMKTMNLVKYTVFTSTMITVVASFALLANWASAQAISNNVSQQVAPLLKPALGELSVSKTPVLLPTWLPPMGSYKYTGLCSYPGSGYQLWLGLTPDACTADTKFYIYGGKGVAHPNNHKVDLGDGRIGYLKNDLIEWTKGKYRYGIGLGLYYPDKKKTGDALIRCAKSTISIPVEELRKAPRGQNRLAEAYAQQKTQQ